MPTTSQHAASLESDLKDDADVFPPVRNICCIGAGYVGGPTCAVLAWKCPDIRVTITDVSQERIDAWNSQDLPIYEPDLEEIVEECRGRNLFFTIDTDKAISDADLIFVSVNTPTKSTGIGAGLATDLCFVEAATRRIAAVHPRGAIIVEKSTVPCRTAASMQEILATTAPDLPPGRCFEVLSNPEFLAEGTAIKDLVCPARILIGSLPSRRGLMAQKRLVEVYQRWVSPTSILTTNLWSSELSKLAANALLAQRVSSINAFAAICEVTEANIEEVSLACRIDPRIGSHFLEAGAGFGGSCFKKDLQNLIYLSLSLNLPEVAHYWEQTLLMNDWTKHRFSRKIVQTMFSTITRKHIAVLGFAFKAGTGDIREAPAISICQDLLAEGAILHIYDPQVSKASVASVLGCPASSSPSAGEYSIETSLKAACLNASAILILTGWQEFSANVDWKTIYDRMSRPAFLFDGRNVIKDPSELLRIGFRVSKVGCGTPIPRESKKPDTFQPDTEEAEPTTVWQVDRAKETTCKR